MASRASNGLPTRRRRQDPPCCRAGARPSLLALVSLLVIAGCVSAVRERVFMPQPIVAEATPWPARAPEAVSVTTADGLILAGRWWPPTRADGVVVVFFPGNAGNVETAARMAEPLARSGDGLLVASWRGYGANPGQPSETGLYTDGDAFVAEAQRRSQGRPLVIFGYSMGGAVAIREAATARPLALMTLGAFTRLADVAPPGAGLVLPDRFDNLAAIRRVTAPTYLFHGTADETVPYAHAERLRTAAGGPARVVTINGALHHVDFATLLPTVERAVAEARGGGPSQP